MLLALAYLLCYHMSLCLMSTNLKGLSLVKVVTWLKYAEEGSIRTHGRYEDQCSEFSLSVATSYTQPSESYLPVSMVKFQLHQSEKQYDLSLNCLRNSLFTMYMKASSLFDSSSIYSLHSFCSPTFSQGEY